MFRTAGVVAVAGLVCIHCGVAQTRPDRFVDSNGVGIRYRVSGRGPSVVLIHGFGETLERWESAGVVGILSPHFQVIAADVRGHGRSGKPHRRESYGAELAADVVRLLRHLGVSKAHIVGYSMGGLVALDFAARHQERALSIALGGVGFPPPEAVDEFTRQAEAFEQGKVPAPNDGDPKALAALLRGLHVVSEEDLRRISVPMAALVGADDRFLPDVRRLSRVLPGVRVVIIPNANHATAVSHPDFSTGLLAFLREQ